MAHCDTVVNADGVEFKGDAACCSNGFFHQFAEGLQVDVAGYYIDVGVAYGDKG